MKTHKLILLTVIAICVGVSCSAQKEKEVKVAGISQTDKIEVYYFHFTHRCETCNAIESVSKEAVVEKYGDKVSFTHFNLDEEDGKAKGEVLEIEGQALLIVCGDKRIDITADGFLNARSNPEKLKAIIQENIDALL